MKKNCFDISLCGSKICWAKLNSLKKCFWKTVYLCWPELFEIVVFNCIKMDLALLNNLQRLKCHKTNQPTCLFLTYCSNTYEQFCTWITCFFIVFKYLWAVPYVNNLPFSYLWAVLYMNNLSLSLAVNYKRFHFYYFSFFLPEYSTTSYLINLEHFNSCVLVSLFWLLVFKLSLSLFLCSSDGRYLEKQLFLLMFLSVQNNNRHYW